MKIEITEFKEPTKMDRKSVTCVKCTIWPNTLDAAGVCSHCRVSDRRQRVKGLWERGRDAIKSLFVKDRGTAPSTLPPSVISD